MEIKCVRRSHRQTELARGYCVSAFRDALEPISTHVTALELLACINAALLLQLLAGVGIAAWWRRGPHPVVPGMVAAEAPTILSGAGPGWREFRVVRREFEDAARTQCSFYLEPVDGVPLTPFKPGQYLTFSIRVGDNLSGVQGSGRTITRCYSLSDGPRPTGYRVTIKRVLPPAGRPDLPPGASSGHFHDRVEEGDILTVKAPSGHFFIDPDPAVPAVLIAGGIGVTPMMSMLQWCLAEQPQRIVYLYYGLRHSGEHAFKQVLERLAQSHPNFHLNVVYSQASLGDVQGRDYQYAGHVDVELLRRSMPHGRHRFYVCGPPPMMASLLPALGAWGVRSEDIHFEAFGPASMLPHQSVLAPLDEARTDVVAPLDVRFVRAGRTLSWDGQDANLLDFAEHHGVEVDSGCRSGSCGSCETPLVSGTVRYAQKPDHDIRPGHCLLCVGTPESALVLGA